MPRYNLIIGLGLALLGTAALARGDFAPQHGPGMAPRIEQLAEQLDVSDEQRAALRGIADSQRPQLRDLHDRMRVNHRALRELDPGADDYQARVSVLATEHGEIAAEMMRLQAQGRAAIHRVLTEEQRRQLRALRAERGRHHHGPGPRDGHPRR